MVKLGAWDCEEASASLEFVKGTLQIILDSLRGPESM
jgi:hypothetical protein